MIGDNPSIGAKRPGVSWRHASAGALSGCATRFVTQPFDVIKIRFQLQLEPIHRKSTTSKYRSIGQTVRTIAAEEGLSGLWKAHLCAQLLSCVYGMIQFSTFELYTQLVNRSSLVTTTGANDPQRQPFLSTHQPLVHFCCGSLAGLSATLVAHPIDVIRTRIIAQSEPKTYTSTPNAFKTIVRTEGYRALFRGLVPTLIQIAPLTGIQFTVYNKSQRLWDTYVGPMQLSEEHRRSDKMQRFLFFEKTFICGGVAGLTAKLTVYPMDLIKKRLQVEGFQKARQGFGAVATYNGFIDCVLKIMRQENVFAFYKGLSPSLMKAAVTTALNFSLYENKESPKPRSPRKSKPRAKRDGKDIVPKDNWNQFEISGKVKESVLKFKIPEEFQTVDDCLKAQKLIKKEQLGSGAFAHVYRVIDIETKDEKAVKSFKLDDRLSPKETIDNFMTELMVMTVLDKHPNIVQIYGSFIIIDSLKKQRKCYIIMELANGGTVLDSMIASMGPNGPVYQPLGEDKAKDYFSQIF
ncbi:unnamed protein product, partial [Oppiella nova]